MVGQGTAGHTDRYARKLGYYSVFVDTVSAERVKEHLAGTRPDDAVRFELPNLATYAAIEAEGPL
jgi:hypothetical protein